MKKQKNQRRFRLVVTISTLFISFIIGIGLFFQQFILLETSKLLITEADRLFSQLNRDLSHDLQTTRRSISGVVEMIAASELGRAESLTERLGLLPVIKAALDKEPHLSGLQAGYDNGDFFIARPLTTVFLRQQFGAPEHAALVVDDISQNSSGRPQLTRLWLDAELHEINRLEQSKTDYDPRLRPWYQEAMASNTSIVTAPYFFHFTRQVGLTIASASDTGKAVIAADMTLYHLSLILADYRLTPSSELVLLERQGDEYLVQAYHQPQELLQTQGERQHRAKLTDLGSAVLNHAAQHHDILQSFSIFRFNNEEWVCATQPLTDQQGRQLYLTMLSPKSELLARALRIQKKMYLYISLIILAAIPITYLLARTISSPIQRLAWETGRVSRFNFQKGGIRGSFIREVDDLGRAMSLMEGTISRFLDLIKSLASEENFDRLLSMTSRETMVASGAQTALTFIVNDTTGHLEPMAYFVSLHEHAGVKQLSPPLCQSHYQETLKTLLAAKRGQLLSTEGGENLAELLGGPPEDSALVYAQPLINRQGDGVGLLFLVFGKNSGITGEQGKDRLAFVEALSGFAAVSLENRQMLKMQKDLLNSFIRLLAGAIDSKSPYTGGHCQRVPVLAELLAQKACLANSGPFASFNLNDQQWEALRIASWLHDCGKVTTPEYVVDKATKLETIYDRIHEIRMRFELIKREQQVACWQKIAGGGEQQTLLADLERQCQQLDEEFSFVARCNLGGEFLDQESIGRLHEIGERTWTRTLDDRLGISWEELARKQETPVVPLPATEKLLADRPDHIIKRGPSDHLDPQHDYGFQLKEPKYLYNRGELYNLTISRGTLSEEERYKINDHIVQSIIMLKKLPYPKHLMDVPDIAGSHHEKIDGSGYPRGLNGEQMPLTARIMVIADVFEALTASDRPYKKAKSIGEAIRILGFMAKDGHIDQDLFRLFLSSGAYLEYGKKYLLPEQLEQVDLSPYLEQ